MDTTSPTKASPGILDWLAALRPNQWTKNAVVAAAFFFAAGDRFQSLPLAASAVRTVLAVAVFCIVSSGIYVFNDLLDREADRAHPEKRFRPIAAGRIAPASAWVLCALLLAGGLSAAACLGLAYLYTVTAYVVIQFVYTLWLKRVAMVDILIIASGFVLRAMAGAFALHVGISSWLLLCAFLLALFLAVCKRRHEKDQAGDNAASQRDVLSRYDSRLLDQLTAIIASATIVSYALYTLSPATVEKFGTSAMGFTIPFVIFGIFRYLDLVYRHRKGDRPEMILLTDWPLLLGIAAYGAAVLAIFFFGDFFAGQP